MADCSASTTPAVCSTPADREKVSIKSGKTPRKKKDGGTDSFDVQVRRLEDKVGRRDAKIDMLKSQLTQVKRREMMLVQEVQRTRELAADSASQTSKQFMKMKTSLSATHERERLLRDQLDTLRSVASTCASSSIAVPSPDRSTLVSPISCHTSAAPHEADRIRSLERQLEEERRKTRGLQADLDEARLLANPTRDAFLARLQARGVSADRADGLLPAEHVVDVAAVIVRLMQEVVELTNNSQTPSPGHNDRTHVDNGENGAKPRGRPCDNAEDSREELDNDAVAVPEQGDATVAPIEHTPAEPHIAGGAALDPDMAMPDGQVPDELAVQQGEGEGEGEEHQQGEHPAEYAHYEQQQDAAHVDGTEQQAAHDANYWATLVHGSWMRYYNEEANAFWFYNTETGEALPDQPEDFDMSQAVYQGQDQGVTHYEEPVAEGEVVDATPPGTPPPEEEHPNENGGFVMVTHGNDGTHEGTQVPDEPVEDASVALPHDAEREAEPVADGQEYPSQEDTVPPAGPPPTAAGGPPMDAPGPSSTDGAAPMEPKEEDPVNFSEAEEHLANLEQELEARLSAVQDEVRSMLPEGVDPTVFLSAVSSPAGEGEEQWSAPGSSTDVPSGQQQAQEEEVVEAKHDADDGITLPAAASPDTTDVRQISHSLDTQEAAMVIARFDFD